MRLMCLKLTAHIAKSWTVSLTGSEVLGVPHAHMLQQVCAAVPHVQRKPESFQFGGTLLVMASINCVEQEMK